MIDYIVKIKSENPPSNPNDLTGDKFLCRKITPQAPPVINIELDKISCLFGGELFAVDAQLVAVAGAPLGLGMVVVVRRSCLVHAVELCLSFLYGDILKFCGSGCSVFGGSGDEHAYYIVVVLEDIIGASSDDNTGTVLCCFTDCVYLCFVCHQLNGFAHIEAAVLGVHYQ